MEGLKSIKLKNPNKPQKTPAKQVSLKKHFFTPVLYILQREVVIVFHLQSVICKKAKQLQNGGTHVGLILLQSSVVEGLCSLDELSVLLTHGGALQHIGQIEEGKHLGVGVCAVVHHLIGPIHLLGGGLGVEVKAQLLCAIQAGAPDSLVRLGN